MLRRLFTDPLLIREMIAEARMPSSECSTYPGIKWTLIISGLAAAVFVIYGRHEDLYSSCGFFAAAAWLQSWLLFRRGGEYMATSVSGSGESGALSVLRTSPFSIGHAVVAKFAGTLMPLGLEMPLIFIINAAVYAVWGSVPWLLLICVSFFQASLILFSAGLGSVFGRCLGNSGKAVRLYGQFAVLFGIVSFGMCYGSSLGSVMLIVFILYLLLFLLPAFNERLSIFSSLLAVFIMVLMPFAYIFGANTVYDAARTVNPFVALWNAQPVDFSDTRSVYLSKLNEDRGFYKFADKCYGDMTGEEHLPDHPRWLEIFTGTVSDDPYAGCLINEIYFKWRIRNLCVFSAGNLLLFAFCFGFIWRKAYKLC